MSNQYVPGEVLLPQVPSLRAQLCLDLFADQDVFRSAMLQLDYLPYALGGASYAVSELARAQCTVVEEKAATADRNSINELNHAERDLLGYLLDSFLDAACRTQNGLVPYLRRKFPQQSLPKSMRDLVDKLSTGRIVLPDDISDFLIEYWQRYGSILRAYRDLAQHYSIVGSEPRVFISPEGQAGLYFSLPNNPEVRSPRALKFDSPQIHAQAFVLEHFAQLLGLCHTIANALLDPNDDRMVIPMTGLRSMITIGAGAPSFYIPTTADEIEKRIAAALQSIGNKSTEGDPS